MLVVLDVALCFSSPLQRCVYLQEMLLHSIPLSRRQPLLRISWSQLKRFRRQEIIFATLFHLKFHLFLLLPRSLCAHHPQIHLNLFLKSPVLPMLLPREGSLGLGERELLCFPSAWAPLCIGKQGKRAPSSPEKSQILAASWALIFLSLFTRYDLG